MYSKTLNTHNLNYLTMKKLLFILTLAVISINHCEAQVSDDSRKKFQFGLKIGSNYSNIYDSNGENFDANGKFGLAGGVFVAIPIGNILGFQPEVLFSQKGYK